MIDIEALAREAGVWTSPKALAAYTNAVLEAAARECEKLDPNYDPDGETCAAAIRALKVTP